MSGWWYRSKRKAKADAEIRADHLAGKLSGQAAEDVEVIVLTVRGWLGAWLLDPADGDRVKDADPGRFVINTTPVSADTDAGPVAWHAGGDQVDVAALVRRVRTEAGSAADR